MAIEFEKLEEKKNRTIWPPQKSGEQIEKEAAKQWWEEESIREPASFERREPLNLGPGIHMITFENEGRDVKTRWTNRSTGETKELDKRVFDVIYDNKKYAFFVTKGATTGSLYGQLVKVAQFLAGLTNKTLKIIVAGQQKQKRYQIQYEGSIPSTF